MLIGGLAMIQHGFTRTTEDIDLLIEPSLDNQRKVKRALEILPDKAIRELGDEDLRDYLVVRVSDEVLVDLMLSACGISYVEACGESEIVMVRGVPVPMATLKILLRMKQTHREKDVLDRKFLEQKLRETPAG